MALNKPAHQDGVHQGRTADLAVDGKSDTCMHPALNKQNIWWSVDLQTGYTVHKVDYFNR